MSEELQKIYDWCEFHKNNSDRAAENADNFTQQMMFTQQSNCYWAVQRFILANFEKDGGKTDEN